MWRETPWARVVLVTATVAMLSVSCDSGVGGSGGTTPTEPSYLLTLESDPETMGVWGISVLKATLTTTAGTPVVAGAIRFSTNLGLLDDEVVLSDSSGEAVTQLRGEGRIGTARVTALLEGSSATAETEVAVGQGVQVQVAANPPAISLGSTALITVVALDNSTGTAVPGGTVVRLETTLGTLDEYRPRTDGLGVATSTLRGGQVPGTALVTASIQNAETEGTVSVVVGGGVRVSMVADPDEIPIEGQCTLWITVRDSDGQPVGPGVEVLVSSTLGRVAYRTPRTDHMGVAATSLRGTGTAGIATVVASVGLTSSDPIEVVIGGSGQ